MHPLTHFFNYLKRKEFAMALAREHLSERDQVEWYPDWMYESMETDEARNQPYRKVIRETVAGKVVLEIGAGRKALWAVCCASAGAKSVYAIEANKRAYQASLRYLRSKKIDNVHLIYGFSDKVQLPERCNVLVHDLVGDIGSSEGMIPFIEDAKRRLLTSDAIHIPKRCTTLAVLAEDPKLSRLETAFSFGMRGFRHMDSLSFVRFFGFPSSAALSEPQVFENIEFDQTPQLRSNKRLVLKVRRDGCLRGLFFFIRLLVSESDVIDSWSSHTCWSTPYVRFNTPTSVKKGDIVELTAQSDLSQNPSYAVELTHIGDESARAIGRYAWAGD
jgi:hypothetical protein